MSEDERPPLTRVVGLGPFPLPGEKRRRRRAAVRADETMRRLVNDRQHEVALAKREMLAAAAPAPGGQASDRDALVADLARASVDGKVADLDHAIAGYEDRPRVYIEPRDWWIGYYRGDTHHYVCPLPIVVIRWPRRTR